MNKKEKGYEPPKMKAYCFDENEKILTSSTGITDPPDPEPTPDYAANALNQLMGGTNTTIELP